MVLDRKRRNGGNSLRLVLKIGTAASSVGNLRFGGQRENQKGVDSGGSGAKSC